MTMTTAGVSSPDPSSASSLLATKRSELLALDARKKSLQAEAEAIVSELTAELPGGGPPVGIDAPLVDAEGFPRGDIDVYRARTLRKRFKEIQTDHKALEKRMDAGLLEIAALTGGESGGGSGSGGVGVGVGVGVGKTTAKEDEEEKAARLAPKPKPKYDAKTGRWVVKSWDGSVAGVENGEGISFEDLSCGSAGALASIAARGGAGGNGSVDGGGAGERNGAPGPRSRQRVGFREEPMPPPFAIIDEVSPGSPAHEAGLKEGDLLLRFGDVDSRSRRDAEFRAIAELVPAAAREGESISVAVRRKTRELGGVVEVTKTERAELRPRTWSGRGLLGCHIRPYTE